MNPILKSALDSWTIPRGTVATLLIIAVIYARGFGKLHAQMPTRFTLARLAAFLGGIAILLIAIASPMAALDDLLLQVHMIQHLMLMLAAPVLILAGWPAIPMLRGLPPRLGKAVLGPILRSRRVRALFIWLTSPPVAWIAFAAATWIWHAPVFFQLALRSEAWHAVEHGCFFATALMFWWPVVQPWPALRRGPRWTMIPYLLLADAQNSALAALFTFSNHLLYPLYANAPRVGGISPLEDQVVAGAIMWVPGSMFFVIPAALILLQLLQPQGMSMARSRIGNAKDGVTAANSIAG
ncbi:MAG: cytochrome c oxidase assembly protein [Candidatus Binatus sp.]|uniref:cytochrome c oxidase assembly protein n=1 Tax=Candidatus Binatus sp. TaxID=2811406 RepID=UPI00271770F1|nr:cytochrome c oxidase assembly protein [Candidatus Binatus sp.]MDO8432385.1 cytochrome c oxidase assembly protein [Candidatus Binatus sp.]